MLFDPHQYFKFCYIVSFRYLIATDKNVNVFEKLSRWYRCTLIGVVRRYFDQTVAVTWFIVKLYGQWKIDGVIMGCAIGNWPVKLPLYRFLFRYFVSQNSSLNSKTYCYAWSCCTKACWFACFTHWCVWVVCVRVYICGWCRTNCDQMRSVMFTYIYCMMSHF